jgi:hypothetical protein
MRATLRSEPNLRYFDFERASKARVYVQIVHTLQNGNIANSLP